MVYTNERNDYDNDEIFANFRSMEGGNLKPNFMYRSASPCDNNYNRAPYVNNLIENVHINTIIDLADSEDDALAYYNDSSLNLDYWKHLYSSGSVYPLNFSANFLSDSYKTKIKQIVDIINKNDGPYLIHCTEGKDRTGFVCALFEAIVGFDDAQIEYDYMKTYDNYYGINKDDDLEKYETIKKAKYVDIYNTILNNNENIFIGAKKYLLEAGISELDINNLINKLSK